MELVTTELDFENELGQLAKGGFDQSDNRTEPVRAVPGKNYGAHPLVPGFRLVKGRQVYIVRGGFKWMRRADGSRFQARVNRPQDADELGYYVSVRRKGRGKDDVVFVSDADYAKRLGTKPPTRKRAAKKLAGARTWGTIVPTARPKRVRKRKRKPKVSKRLREATRGARIEKKRVPLLGVKFPKSVERKLSEINSMLKDAEVQREATSEHHVISNRKEFRSVVERALRQLEAKGCPPGVARERVIHVVMTRGR
jgi:hypothetical protein